LRRSNRGCNKSQGRIWKAKVSRAANRHGRPPAFSYQPTWKGLLRRRSAGLTLRFDETSLERLAERFGTPLYVYSASAIRQRVRAFEHAFRKAPHTICYSVKA